MGGKVIFMHPCFCMESFIWNPQGRMRMAVLHMASVRPASSALCVAARSALQQAGYAEVVALKDAQVPIVTFTDPRTHIRCQKAFSWRPVCCVWRITNEKYSWAHGNGLTAHG